MSHTKIVNRSKIDDWIRRNGPDGLAKLALKARLSTSLLSKIRGGKVPKPLSQTLLAAALECSEDEVFVPVSEGQDQAS